MTICTLHRYENGSAGNKIADVADKSISNRDNLLKIVEIRSFDSKYVTRKPIYEERYISVDGVAIEKFHKDEVVCLSKRVDGFSEVKRYVVLSIDPPEIEAATPFTATLEIM